MRYLFICSAGQNRSLIVAAVTQQITSERDMKIESDYLGINRTTTPKKLGELVQSGAANSIIQQAMREAAQSKNKIGRADKIFVMEEWMGQELRENYKPKAQIICLDIVDIYEQNDSGLIEILREKLSPDL